jgi:hypothetical protein
VRPGSHRTDVKISLHCLAEPFAHITRELAIRSDPHPTEQKANAYLPVYSQQKSFFLPFISECLISASCSYKNRKLFKFQKTDDE